MKYTDFSQPGGFPLTQNRLEELVSNLTEGILAVASRGGNIAGPMVMSGMDISEDTPGTIVVTDGWFVYDGKLIRFVGDSVTPGVGEVALVEITTTSTTLPLPYNNATTPNVVNEDVATLIADATVTDDTHFPLSDLKPWGREKNWTTVTFPPDTPGTPGNFSGSIKYKKDWLNNTLRLQGEINVFTTTDLGSSYDVTPVLLTTLPSGYRPLDSSVGPIEFIAHSGSGEIVLLADEAATVTCFTGSLLDDGRLYINLVKAAAAYTVRWETMFILD